MSQELYFSVDVEADGPIPGPNSMLQFGAVALTEYGDELGSFTRNLETLPGASPAPDTMAWWSREENRAAYEMTRVSLVSPSLAMEHFVGWVESFKMKPVFVAYPAGYDFLFMYWYMVRFTGGSPFSFSALDIKSYAMAMLRRGYRDCAKKDMPKRWFSDARHTHFALDDAREQGQLFIKMLNENLALA